MRVVFRVDASNEIGYGHVMRCLSLAQALRCWSVESVFICKQLPNDLIHFIESLNYRVYSFVGDDAQMTSKLIDEMGSVDILIVDHYQLDRAWEEQIKPKVSTLMVVDDLAERPHACDVLLDPSYARTQEHYKGLLPKTARSLLGPDYALLSSSYSDSRYQALDDRKKTKSIQRVLISFGGADPNNITGFVIEALSDLPQVLSLDVVAKAHWPHFEEIKKAIERSHHKISLHTDVSNLTALLSSVDLAVGAGGVSSYERCCLGLPSLMFSIADNQNHNAQHLDHAKAALFLGSVESISKELIVNAVEGLIKQAKEWQTMSSVAASICDGYGANRVAAFLMTKRDALQLRPVQLSDSELMFQWQQEKTTRQFARNPQAPARSEHDQWFQQRFQDPNCLFNIMELSGEAVGVLRLDRIANKANGFEISILVTPEHRQKGIAAKALSLARQIFSNLTFYAEVHADNQASHRLFLNAGYVYEGDVYVNRPKRTKEFVV